MHRSLKVLRVSGWVVGGGYTLCLRTWMISFFSFLFFSPFFLIPYTTVSGNSWEMEILGAV